MSGHNIKCNQNRNFRKEEQQSVQEIQQPEQRIGIMGGTFNPIHNGHLMIAENAREQFALEKVLFIPTGHSPHKQKQQILEAATRCEMVSLAIKDNPGFVLDETEVRSSGLSYTYLTLQKLKEDYINAKFFFILGADSLFDLEGWKEPAKILENCTVLAAGRVHEKQSEFMEHVEYLKAKYQCEIFPLDTPNLEVASRDIRNRVQTGRTIRYLVPNEVEYYIKKHHLYEEVSQQPSVEDRGNKMERAEIEKKLKKELDKERYTHTLGVMYTAAALAMTHGADMEKALLAGLLHDCAKCIPNDEKMKLCKKHKLYISNSEERNPFLLHAKLGAYLARKKYKVEDKEVLHAITVHTTGEPEMSLLDKIVYIADYIEPNRDKAPNLENVRKVAFQDLDKTMIMILSDTLSYLKEKGGEIDPLTVQTYEYFLEQQEKTPENIP